MVTSERGLWRRPCSISYPLFGVVLAIASGLGALVLWYCAATRPADESGQPVVVEIKLGSGARAIAKQLEAQGLIRSATAFEGLLALTGQAGSLRAGYYELSPTMGAAKMASKLAAGEVVVRRVTVPEGLHIEEIAERIAEAGLATKQEFLAGAVRGKVAAHVKLELPPDSLEGYLFPETYDFTLGTDPVEISARMVRELHDRFVRPHEQEIADSKLSLHELITLASLVEREAKLPEERALIAGVLLNRLSRDMLLQCDASVQYALGEHKSRILCKDLAVDSPHNTYLYKGLPPGPIASPGLASLEAVLSPARTDTLYYVARPDGGHVFSKTYQEHLTAIAGIRSR